MMADKLDGKIITEFAALRPNTCSYWTDINNGRKNQKAQKRVIKPNLKFEDYKHCLEETQLENKINQLKKR